MNFVTRSSLLAAVSFGSLMSPAFAQQIAPADAPAPAAAEAAPAQASTQAAPVGGAGTDIVVTANKREQKLNDVGLTITAISSQQLAERRITSLQDVAAAVPGLTYASSTQNTPIYTLRGVGFNEAALGVYPAVSVYLDQIPLNFPVMASHSAYDLQRIEALKGPQGTLFGQNATGGAINYIAATPTNEFHAGGDLSYGRFNDFVGNAYVSGPIAENLTGRIAITGEHADGWQKSYTHDGTMGDSRYIAGRILLKWEPSDRLRFNFNANGWIDHSQPQALQYIAFFPAKPNVATEPALAAVPFSPQTPRAADWSTGANEPFSHRKFGQIALRADYDLTDWATLTSITSYNAFSQKQATDGDGMALVDYDLGVNNGTLHSFNQELRLANSGHSHFRWVIGGNFEKSRAKEQQSLNYINSTNYEPSVNYIFESGNKTDQRIRNMAVFGNIEYDLTSKLTLKGGVRYTDARNHANLCGYDLGDGHVAGLFTLLGGLLSGSPVTPLSPGECYTLTPANVPEYTPYNRVLHEHNVSWRGGLDYKIAPGYLLYANVSRGYKAGSFPTVAAATETQLAPVTQESVTAYEAGFKFTLLDRMLQFDAAGFYYDYRNKQVRGKVLDPIFGILDTLINVPKSRITGAETEITLTPTRGLTLTAGVTYLQSKVLKYTGVNVTGATEDFRGVDLPFTPKWTYTFDGEYKLPRFSNGGGLFVGGTVTGRSSETAAFDGDGLTLDGLPKAKSAPGAERPYHIDGYATLDLRAGYEAPDGRWRVQVWGKNVTNKYYWTNVIPATDVAGRFAGRPATYGVTLGFKM
ncbi:TonB-dependent receptor [Sphingomonas sp. CGMCC 1.13654]|uniref:TonB-dependent receptor n=1 Tax=Sphingomonas chungangi TaxID=2683589 RepID=A0A838LBL3_9SPHN|nr:TonB-dependent receptor [Sphingomonas chungangi]MBA2935526.1 TonB-dependent receptor [Sphingomonas chungangi]MVW57033.1 TonB-dependent receptor [Sphingomonas chungangi]